MKESVKRLFDEINKLLSDSSENSKLPENTFFLGKDKVLCLPRKHGDSRYPYCADGFSLWAYQSGYFSANESTFTLFPWTDEGKRPNLAFFFGVKKGEEYCPISFTGACVQPREKFKRYTVFAPYCAYYLTECDEFRLALRVTVNSKKRIECTLYAENLSTEDKNVYFSTYLNPLLRFQENDDFESKWFKKSTACDNGFFFESKIDLTRTEHINYYAVQKRLVNGEISAISETTAHTSFTGGKSVPLNCAEALFNGCFEEPAKVCCFTDTAISGEIVRLNLNGKSSCEENISFEYLTDKEKALVILNDPIKAGEFDETVRRKKAETEEKRTSENALKIEFENFMPEKGEVAVLNDHVFNRFIVSVINQVEYCAMAKTSSISMLGIRDVFQQIESALIWNRAGCRKKILEALDFIGTDGRVPRQYSFPADKNSVPAMDLRAFIDQGVWIIDTVYTYLAYTGDESILREQCGYYVYKNGKVFLTDERDSVFGHLVRILDYLIDKIDENTDCLRILYGDWNDALDGLGETAEKDKEFGSGVSVMASLQLVKNLREMCEIIDCYKLPRENKAKYQQAYNCLKNGLIKNAIVQNGNEKKILHGWGDKRSYLVGSFCDADGFCRDGLAANAYWVISGAYSWDKSIKSHILSAFDRLDSKYGLKTFEPHFAEGAKGVGRIPNLPKGTAENGATYVHATLFGIWALFLMGEGETAWKQLCKILPLTHEKISTSPFIMSNSYVYNEELHIDGESMNDWYTGSATVLLKVLLRCVFGINVSQTKLSVEPAGYIPFGRASISVKVRNCIVKITYSKNGNGKRKYFVDENPAENAVFDLNSLGDEKSVEIIE